ncbi:hypothetical protein CEXT_671501 [Caerostris extrusa]|uniref:Ycf15 n=1 Tax=Caerostris extrusa TaxID=172846 RepID=A0AAV4RY46_CAEEX|nr:hypothetical protein CEXT_671501 [Caerostris extrusa]
MLFWIQIRHKPERFPTAPNPAPIVSCVFNLIFLPYATNLGHFPISSDKSNRNRSTRKFRECAGSRCRGQRSCRSSGRLSNEPNRLSIN